MVESMHALVPLRNRQPAARKPRLPHPYLPARPAEPVSDPTPGTQGPPILAPQSESWTPAAVPMTRPAGRPNRHRVQPTPAERTLRNALRFGFFVNAAALLAPRLFPDGTFPAWEYGGGDFLLAAAVLLSGQALLMLGRRGAPPHQG
ncbi:MAG TPA: hypothetical protein VN493_23785 [Thermoanaerobaculia bacterium]|nr:hypothetical protein [Thermoanaerobaculia bacterium]